MIGLWESRADRERACVNLREYASAETMLRAVNWHNSVANLVLVAFSKKITVFRENSVFKYIFNLMLAHQRNGERTSLHSRKVVGVRFVSFGPIRSF